MNITKNGTNLVVCEVDPNFFIKCHIIICRLNSASSVEVISTVWVKRID